MLASSSMDNGARGSKPARTESSIARSLTFLAMGPATPIEGSAIDGIVDVRAEAKLRRIGLADDDGAGVAQPLDQEAVRRRYEILQERGAPRRADALDRQQILDRMGKAVERPLRLAARQFGVALPRLRQQLS